MIEIFRTNVIEAAEAKSIIEVILSKYPDLEVNFDLEDCDKILRVCGFNFSNLEISEQLHKMGHRCEVLEG
ncbi:hypothetical protein BA768_00450 [Chryseobacterium sp. CBo1]|uniref:hypothetical protein n=1 Tax=Chryseobacterium TaxID=59732 RepID=UPI0008108D9F|nr:MULTISPECIES: hypothetical protein [Chryseobacterium]OCK53061.1 hypothetical protein BA768_00450 [Chryseobacterium sp. CBo1]